MISLTVTDGSPDGGLLSGIGEIDAMFCRWEFGHCGVGIKMFATDGVSQTGRRTHVMGQRMGPTYPAGTYKLVEVGITDNAGNRAVYTSPALGGTVNFDDYFEGPTFFEALP